MLEAHIATSHIYYTPYECEFCGNALFPTDRALRDHYKNIHNVEDFVVCFHFLYLYGIHWFGLECLRQVYPLLVGIWAC